MTEPTTTKTATEETGNGVLYQNLVSIKRIVSSVGMQRFNKLFFEMKENETLVDTVERLSLQYADNCSDLTEYVKRNRELQEQIETLTQERDRLRTTIEKVKKQTRKTS